MRSILQVPQGLARTASGNANSARAPHAHLGALMSTIPGNLHFAQQLVLASPLNPKIGCFPHVHLAFTRSTMPTDLQLMQYLLVNPPACQTQTACRMRIVDATSEDHAVRFAEHATSSAPTRQAKHRLSPARATAGNKIDHVFLLANAAALSPFAPGAE
eukprot:CAMPEP_0203943500 /NCGR_PEP_ID=MMETSP0359-20131031/79449_1 /ASSEMBLY_ACC=CAM_ASM_000338 /TAXON_ID=268821 /ORGANISM="Scrippsiella Hangoei, Strain SHTV-5" /LENGTH=158 /DNA_ID=CAMNT_0050874379 /DNA_START=75 /DNA_END=553 /DNA_ORIENTATION=+